MEEAIKGGEAEFEEWHRLTRYPELLRSSICLGILLPALPKIADQPDLTVRPRSGANWCPKLLLAFSTNAAKTSHRKTVA
jgi:hypothetical protein